MRNRLLVGLLALVLACGGLFVTADSAKAAGTLYIGANCNGPGTCQVWFFMYGGGDNYDCVTVRMYWTYYGGSGYNIQSLCGAQGNKLVQFNIQPGRHVNSVGITYNDGIGAARTECYQSA